VAAQQEAPGEATAIRTQQTHQLMKKLRFISNPTACPALLNLQSKAVACRDREPKILSSFFSFFHFGYVADSIACILFCSFIILSCVFCLTEELM
jgi:hypothetical protein